MVDIVSPQVRSRMMSGIRGADTKPERVVRKLLHVSGYRPRPRKRILPGRPDIVLGKEGIAIFVHGCFWHRHRGCAYAKLPSTNKAFWRKKLSGNAERDAKNEKLLLEQGWRVLTVWECATRRRPAEVDHLAKRILSWIRSRRKRGEIPRQLAT